MKRSILFLLLFCGACAGAQRAETTATAPDEAPDPAIQAAGEINAAEVELDRMFGAEAVLECGEANRLKDQICLLSDRICGIAQRRPDRAPNCEDSKTRCDRAKTRVGERCP